MGFFSGLTKIVCSPIRAVAEVAKDLTGDNGDENQFLSVATLGVSSVVKGAAKAIKEASEDIFEDDL